MKNAIIILGVVALFIMVFSAAVFGYVTLIKHALGCPV